jgi:general transcription factor 3C polypeptide 5 (transcription factor C subunit 1)
MLNPAKADTSVNLMLRPEDALSRTIQSTSCPSNNVLLKVTVPKRTGRKRKRGTNDPFVDATPESTGEHVRRRPAKEIMRSLSDNPSKYRVEAMGKIERTHVFRGLYPLSDDCRSYRLTTAFPGMPDFVYSTARSAFINKFREQILPYDCKFIPIMEIRHRSLANTLVVEKIKQFDLDMSKGATVNVDLIPPSAFSQGDVPFQYMYVKRYLGLSRKLTYTFTY